MNGRGGGNDDMRRKPTGVCSLLQLRQWLQRKSKLLATRGRGNVSNEMSSDEGVTDRGDGGAQRRQRRHRQRQRHQWRQRWRQRDGDNGGTGGDAGGGDEAVPAAVKAVIGKAAMEKR